jgi:hypothetical protein
VALDLHTSAPTGEVCMAKLDDREPTSIRRKHRRCQRCDAVHPAAAFTRVNQYVLTRDPRGRWGLRCPSCGFTAPPWAFVEAEPPQGSHDESG